MSPAKSVFGLVVVVVLSIAFYSAAFVVPEGRQAIVTQFGRPIGGAKTAAGLYFKVPIIQEVRFVDKRILNWDGDADKMPTGDKKYIFVDTTARWKVSNPLKFIQTVQSERGAIQRLNDIIDGATRKVISRFDLVEAVRNSNEIVEKVNLMREEIQRKRAEGVPLKDEEELTGEIENIKSGREKLSLMILEDAAAKLTDLGIVLIDVQLKRIAYEEEVEKKVYERMISERNRIAEKIRSVGLGEQSKIRGKIEEDLKKIQSGAYRTSQEIKGKAEAQAIRIYAATLGKDPSFYEFVRSLEAYKNGLKPDSEFILSSDSDFLKFLRKSPR